MRERIIGLFFIGFILLISSFCGCVDNDSDGDGYANDVDVFPDDPFEWKDSDNDGVGDNGDEFPNNPYEQIDSDKDGVGNNDDDFPYDSTQWVDRDNDGYGDNPNGINYDKFPDDPLEWNDTDNDGVGDNSDLFPNDPSEQIDSDNDGTGDNSDFYPTGNALIEVYVSNYKYLGSTYDSNDPIQFFIEIIGIDGIVTDNWDLLDSYESDFFYDTNLIDPVIYIFDIDDSYESFNILVSVKLITSPQPKYIDIDWSSFSEVQDIIFEPQINDYIWINDFGDYGVGNYYVADINLRIRIKY